MESLLPVIVGAGLALIVSIVTTEIQLRMNTRRQSKAVRTILKLEMDSNLQLLADFWSSLIPVNEQERDIDTQKQRSSLSFIDAPLPVFTQRALDSQMSFLSDALNESEIMAVFRFHDRFGMLKTIRSELILAMQEQRTDLQAATIEGKGDRHRLLAYVPLTPFNKKAPGMWDECDRIVKQILAEGNPLK